MSAEPRPGAREAQRDAALGGQAVAGGVMIRGRKTCAVAVRAPDGKIVVQSFPFAPQAVRTPVVRGIVAFAESLWLGAQGLAVARRRDWIVTPALALGVVALFVAPALLTGSVVVEGVLRVALFVAAVALLSCLPGLQRAFRYHGAEHQAVACLEAGLPLTPQNALRCARVHPRCGTGFLLVAMIVAGLVFAPFGTAAWYVRLLGLPLVVGLAFELVRLSGRARAFAAPGLLLQRLTTREPEAGQLAVAIAAVEAVQAVEAPRAPAMKAAA
jgi:uncharacterized protein YqhQ